MLAGADQRQEEQAVAMVQLVWPELQRLTPAREVSAGLLPQQELHRVRAQYGQLRVRRRLLHRQVLARQMRVRDLRCPRQ